MTTPPDIAKAHCNGAMRALVRALPEDLGAITVVYQCGELGLVHFASTHDNATTCRVLRDLCTSIEAVLAARGDASRKGSA